MGSRCSSITTIIAPRTSTPNMAMTKCSSISQHPRNLSGVRPAPRASYASLLGFASSGGADRGMEPRRGRTPHLQNRPAAMKLLNKVKSVRHLGAHRVRLVFRDGSAFDLDLNPICDGGPV